MLRSSLAARLLAGGLTFTALLIGCVSGFLLVSRSQQTSSGALSNSDNRAGVAAQLLTRVTEPQAQYAAASLATLPSLQTALAGAVPETAVAQEFANKQVVAVPGLATVVLDAHGGVVYTTECDSSAPGGAATHPATAQCASAPGGHVTGSTPSVKTALGIASKPACRNAATAAGTGGTLCPAGAEGTELLASTAPAFDVAVPVLNSLDGSYTPLGVVVYSAPLRTEFQRFGPVIGFTPVFVPAARSAALLRFGGGAPVANPVPAPLVTKLSSATVSPQDSGVLAHAVYGAPGAGDVAGSFVALPAPGATTVGGYLGVEVPLSVFAAATAQDERTIAEIAITAMVVVSLLVLLFVEKFVRRPVSRLERAVGRIADGDYTTELPVKSKDELGRLAVSVNRMRTQIAGYVRHIDGSIERLQDVSRALTTTTGGLKRLQDAVLGAAAATAGVDATATLLVRRGDELFLSDVHGHARESVLDPATVAQIIRGEPVRIDRMNHHLLAVPMFYQGDVSGALVTVTNNAVFESDQRTLQALANNAAVALENTRLFEQERMTVQRLSELNQMKSEFLSNAQHELRTPVLAIQGQLELLTLAWERFDDASKMDTLRDIEISTRLLGELLDTILDFSLLSSDTIDLRFEPVEVSGAVDEALGDIRGHFAGDIPVEVMCFITEGSIVRADAQRFRKVIRSLLDNAVKFTPAGGHVSLHAQPDGTGMCRIDVVDDGMGIPPEALPRVFDRFYQVDGSRTRRHGGMGMGLALVKRLCEAHGATVSAESEPGKGSRFTILWPLVAETRATPPNGSESRNGSHSASGGGNGSTAGQRRAGVAQLS